MSFRIYNTEDYQKREYQKPLTPQHSNYIYHTTDLRVPKFMMEQAIQSRMKYYQKHSKSNNYLQWKNINNSHEELVLLKKQLAQVRDRPSISPNSAQIYDRVKQKRNLSPNVLKRFEQYQQQKQKKLLRMRIVKFMCQTNKIPKPKDILKSKNCLKNQEIKQLIKEVTKNLQQKQN